MKLNEYPLFFFTFIDLMKYFLKLLIGYLWIYSVEGKNPKMCIDNRQMLKATSWKDDKRWLEISALNNF